MEQSVILNLNDPAAKQVALAGGKGASLAHMLQAGIHVPPGFIVPAAMFASFMTTTGLQKAIDARLAEVDFEDIAAVQAVADTIQNLISKEQVPKAIAAAIEAAFLELGAEYVAVRSSATAEDSQSASWAGELETYLNTTQQMLLEHVKDCWRSLFSARALTYRYEQGLHATEIAVAVVVQKMVESEVAGIAFTTHPVTKNPHQMIIEAGWGLGELVVGGEVIPDTYIIDKTKRQIMTYDIGDQEVMLVRGEHGNKSVPVPAGQKTQCKLSDTQLRDLADACLRVEDYYSFPCDIEWAYEQGHFYIVQSRPITTL